MHIIVNDLLTCWSQTLLDMATWRTSRRSFNCNFQSSWAKLRWFLPICGWQICHNYGKLINKSHSFSKTGPHWNWRELALEAAGKWRQSPELTPNRWASGWHLAECHSPTNTFLFRFATFEIGQFVRQINKKNFHVEKNTANLGGQITMAWPKNAVQVSLKFLPWAPIEVRSTDTFHKNLPETMFKNKQWSHITGCHWTLGKTIFFTLQLCLKWWSLYISCHAKQDFYVKLGYSFHSWANGLKLAQAMGIVIPGETGQTTHAAQTRKRGFGFACIFPNSNAFVLLESVKHPDFLYSPDLSPTLFRGCSRNVTLMR